MRIEETAAGRSSIATREARADAASLLVCRRLEEEAALTKGRNEERGKGDGAGGGGKVERKGAPPQ